MNALKYILTLVIMSVTITSCRAQRDLSELSAVKGVETVYVGKSMLRLAGAAAGNSLKTPGFDGQKLLNKLSSIEIVTSDQLEACKKVNKLLKNLDLTKRLETLTEITDDEDHVIISGDIDTITNVVKKVVLHVNEPGEVTVIVLSGNIPMSMIEEALSGASKD